MISYAIQLNTECQNKQQAERLARRINGLLDSEINPLPGRAEVIQVGTLGELRPGRD